MSHEARASTLTRSHEAASSEVMVLKERIARQADEAREDATQFNEAHVQATEALKARVDVLTAELATVAADKTMLAGALQVSESGATLGPLRTGLDYSTNWARYP